MILAIDVQYWDNKGFVSAVAFNDWAAAEPNAQYEAVLFDIAEYEPGQFYKRELPCILKLLNDNALHPSVIVVDGYVTLNDQGTLGLGMHLYQALDNQLTVIGVAKRAFSGIHERSKLFRGKSKNPLFVTSAGMDVEEAKNHILAMHGENRVPVLLKLVDRLCREQASAAAGLLLNNDSSNN